MPEPHNYRLAINPQTGEHGYEVGYWSTQNPPQYIVQARCYDQHEAARLAAQFDAAPPPNHLPPDESGEGQAKDEDDDVHVKAKRPSTHRR